MKNKKKEAKRLLRGWEKPSEAIYAALTSMPIYVILGEMSNGQNEVGDHNGKEY